MLVGLVGAWIAYVSYNVLPGGRLSGALRQMSVHTAGLDDPEERIEQARGRCCGF